MLAAYSLPDVLHEPAHAIHVSVVVHGPRKHHGVTVSVERVGPGGFGIEEVVVDPVREDGDLVAIAGVATGDDLTLRPAHHADGVGLFEDAGLPACQSSCLVLIEPAPGPGALFRILSPLVGIDVHEIGDEWYRSALRERQILRHR